MKFTKSSYELRMEYKWTSHEFHMKWNQIYSHEFTCSSHENHINFISNDLNFMWITWQVHKKFLWIWLLASLLCTSFEWASMSIVVYSLLFGMMGVHQGKVFLGPLTSRCPVLNINSMTTLIRNSSIFHLYYHECVITRNPYHVKGPW